VKRINPVSDHHVDIAGNALASLPPVDADVTVVVGDAMAPGALSKSRSVSLRLRPAISTFAVLSGEVQP